MISAELAFTFGAALAASITATIVWHVTQDRRSHLTEQLHAARRECEESAEALRRALDVLARINAAIVTYTATEGRLPGVQSASWDDDDDDNEDLADIPEP